MLAATAAALLYYIAATVWQSFDFHAVGTFYPTLSARSLLAVPGREPFLARGGPEDGSNPGGGITRAQFVIRTASPWEDVFVSRQIHKTGVWDAHVFEAMLDALGWDAATGTAAACRTAAGGADGGGGGGGGSARNPAGLVVDVGANLGFFSLAARALGCNVLAVEADPALVQHYLEVSAALNSMTTARIRDGGGTLAGLGRGHGGGARAASPALRYGGGGRGRGGRGGLGPDALDDDDAVARCGGGGNPCLWVAAGVIASSTDGDVRWFLPVGAATHNIGAGHVSKWMVPPEAQGVGKSGGGNDRDDNNDDEASRTRLDNLASMSDADVAALVERVAAAAAALGPGAGVAGGAPHAVTAAHRAAAKLKVEALRNNLRQGGALDVASSYDADVARGRYDDGADAADAAAPNGRRRLLRTRTLASLLQDVAAARAAAVEAHFRHATGVRRPAPRVLPVNGPVAVGAHGRGAAGPGAHGDSAQTTSARAMASSPLEILFLKIDVEGHEPSVLRGAEALFKARRVRTLVVEADLRNPETRSALLRLVTHFRYAMRALGPVAGRCRRSRRWGATKDAATNSKGGGRTGRITHEAQFEAWAKCIVGLPTYHGRADLRFDRLGS